MSSLSLLFSGILQKYGPLNCNYYIGNFPGIGLVKLNELISFISGLVIVTLYFFTKNWILNNMIGVALVIMLVRTVRIPNYLVGFLMLGFAFFYDIFWVFYSSRFFGKSVMAYVATNINLPMKITCPILLNDFPLQSCSLLGLGDMALPGFFISFCHYFDALKKINVYHNVSMICYSIALTLCIICLVVFQSAQPALLYISPCLIFGVGYVAWRRGELSEIWIAKDEKYNTVVNSKKKHEFKLKDKNDEKIEQDKEENYYNNHSENTIFEFRKDDI